MLIKLCIRNSILRQYIAAFVCSISLVTLGCAVGWTSPAIPKLRNGEANIAITDSEITWGVAISYLANMLTPMPCGWLMDKIGRKNSLLVINFFALESWLTLLFAQKPWHLYVGRFTMGINFSAVYTIVPMYLAEISESKIRGSIGSFMSVMIYVGTMIEYAVGPFVSYKTLALVSFCIPVAFMLTFIWIPESPYYLIMKKKTVAAEKSLTWLRYDKSKEDISNELNSIISLTEKQMKESGKYSDLVKTKGNRRALFIAETLAVIQRLSGIGPLIAYSSITIPDNTFRGVSKHNLIMILGIVWLLSSITSSYLVDKLGRKILLMVSCTGCGIACLSASCWFYLNEHTAFDVTGATWVPYVAFIFHALFYSLGLGPIAIAIKGELFPSKIKGKASAITTTVLATTSFLLNKIYLITAGRYGLFSNFMVYGVTCLTSVLFVIFFVIETKGKSFGEIQDELNGIRRTPITSATDNCNINTGQIRQQELKN